MDEIPNESKTPTWQWVAGLAISGMLFLSCLLLVTALSAIKANSESIISLNLRMTSAEKTVPLQFEMIQHSLDQIRDDQVKQAEMLTKSAMTLKEWKRIN